MDVPPLREFTTIGAVKYPAPRKLLPVTTLSEGVWWRTVPPSPQFR